jgi:OFA family oxalate/formate antiporter-like MFS transporter
MIPPRAESPGAWRSLAILSLLFFLIIAGTFTSLGVVLPDMVSGLGWDWAGAGLGFTLLGVSCGLASYAPTLLIRRIGVRATLLLGGVVAATGFACLHWTRGLDLYWAGTILAGVGFALVATIPGTYVLARVFHNRSMAFGLYFTAGGLGGVAGPWLYLAVKGWSGDWRAYWLVLAVAVTLIAALASVIVATDDVAPEPATSEAGAVFKAARDWRVRDALAAPQFWIITAAYTVYLLCETTVNGLSVAHLTERGVAPTVAAGMLSLQALLNAGARGFGGAIGERVDPRKLVIFALAAVAVGIGALAMARGTPLMLTYALGVGVGYGLSNLAATVLLLNYFGRERNLELFSIMCLVSTLAAAGPWIAGLARDRLGGFEHAFWLFAAMAVVVLLAVALMRPPRLASEG